MPSDPLDGIHTKRGRVVYNRKKHPMTDADRRRIAGLDAPEAKNRAIEQIISVVDTMSEELLSIILARFAVPPGLSDELLVEIKKIVSNSLAKISVLEQYLKEARGPLGIPGEGVF